MKLKRVILISVVLMAAVGAVAAERRVAVDAVVVPMTLKFNGFVSISASEPGGRLNMQVFVTVGGRVIADGIMKLMGRPAAFGDGAYWTSFSGVFPRPGDVIMVTFQSPRTGATLYTAAATTPPTLVLGNPAKEARVTLTGGGSLDIRWSGGFSPYYLVIDKIGADGSKVFEKRDIAGTSVSVPLALFVAGSRYRIRLTDSKVKFTFDHPVDRNSSLGLYQYLYSYFTAE